MDKAEDQTVTLISIREMAAQARETGAAKTIRKTIEWLSQQGTILCMLAHDDTALMYVELELGNLTQSIGKHRASRIWYRRVLLTSAGDSELRKSIRASALLRLADGHRIRGERELAEILENQSRQEITGQAEAERHLEEAGLDPALLKGLPVVNPYTD